MRDAPDRALTDHWEFLARVVQAQRLICVQANCTADDALILMRERARATDHRVVEIAEDVVAHRMWFD
jgi:AmiR/NasT family two-component response regulator